MEYKTTFIRSYLILSISFLIGFSAFAQTQIGNDVYADGFGDRFGHCLDISADGSTLIVGARSNDSTATSAGQIKIYEDSLGSWVQKGASIFGDTLDCEFGTSVAISRDGNTIIASAPYYDQGVSAIGYTRVYEWDSSQWVQKGNTLKGISGFDRLGYTTDINNDGNIIAITKYNQNNLIFIYEWINNAWVRKGPAITSTNPSDETGYTINFNRTGNRIAVSSTLGTASSLNCGLVRVFEWNGLNWGQVGANISGLVSNERFGSAVALNGSGNRIAIGASKADVNGTDAGYAKIFEWNGTSWTQLGQTLLGDTLSEFGHDVSLNDSGDVLSISAPRDDNSIGSRAGSTNVYVLIGNQWILTGNTILGQGPSHRSGFSIALDSAGNRLANSAISFCVSLPLCGGNARVFDIRQIVGIDQIGQANVFEARVFPNPFYEAFKVDLGEKSNGTAIIRDISGKVVYETNFINNSLINLSPNIPSGIYFLDIKLQNGERSIKKIIKQ